MPRDPDKYDFFVSCARADDGDGRITAFVDELLGAHRQRAQDAPCATESETTVPPHNRQFSGRLDDLLDLLDRLKDDRVGVISEAHGMGGIGKSELTFAYAHAFAGAYPGGRFLIQCEGKSTLRGAVLGTDKFTQIDFIREGVSDGERMQPDVYLAAIMRCLRERLKQRGRILLVLDNVTDAELLSPKETDRMTALGPMLHLLANTRLPAGTSRRIAWVTLEELSEAESLELLEKHCSFAGDAEREAARKISQRLRGFGLAIELVGAWLGANESASYSGLADEMGLDDLDFFADDQDVRLRQHNHERRLQAVLQPTLAELSSSERLTIQYAACLAPDHVPLPWLRELVVDQFPELSAARRRGDPWRKLCGRLTRLAIFSRADGCRLVRIHRLVQDLIRRELSDEDLSARQQAIAALVRRRGAVLEKTAQWQDARWELEPLDVLANIWANNRHPDAAWLLNNIALRWYELAEWPRAEPLMRRVLAIDEQYYGADHPNVATSLNNLAQFLHATNRLEEAEPPMRRALAIDEHFYGTDHPNVAAQLNNLALLLHATNRLTEAVPLMRRALAIGEQSYGAEHPTVTIRLGNLAQFLQDTNRLAEAEPLMRRVVRIFEKSLGPDHPHVGTSLNNLAQLLKATKRLAEAEPLMRRALAIDEQSYGADHPNVAARLNNLAQLLKATNRLAEAEPLIRRALAIGDTVPVGSKNSTGHLGERISG